MNILELPVTKHLEKGFVVSGHDELVVAKGVVAGDTQGPGDSQGLSFHRRIPCLRIFSEPGPSQDNLPASAAAVGVDLLAGAPLLSEEEPNPCLGEVSHQAGPLTHPEALDSILDRINNDLLGLLEQLGQVLVPVHLLALGWGLEQLSEGLHHFPVCKEWGHLIDKAKPSSNVSDSFGNREVCDTRQNLF